MSNDLGSLPTGSGDQSGAGALTSLGSLSRVLIRMPYSLLVTVTVVIALLKCGAFFHSLVTPAELNQPGGFVFLNANVGPNVIVSALRLVSIRTFTGYEVLSLALTLGCLALVALVVSRASAFDESRRLIAVLLLGGPLTLILLGHFGSNDPLFLLGAVTIAAFPRKLWLVGLCSLVMALSNPGQAILVAISLGLMSLIPRYRSLCPAFLSLGLVSVLVFALVLVRSRLVDGPSQVTYFFSDLARAVDQNSQILPLLIYSGYGVLSLIFLWAVFDARGWERLLLVAVLFGVPIFMAATWIDGTRYIVNLTTVPAVVLLLEYAPRICTRLQYRNQGLAVGVAFVVTIAFPLVHVFGGTVREPYAYILERSQFYLAQLF